MFGASWRYDEGNPPQKAPASLWQCTLAKEACRGELARSMQKGLLNEHKNLTVLIDSDEFPKLRSPSLKPKNIFVCDIYARRCLWSPEFGANDTTRIYSGPVNHRALRTSTWYVLLVWNGLLLIAVGWVRVRVGSGIPKRILVVFCIEKSNRVWPANALVCPILQPT